MGIQWQVDWQKTRHGVMPVFRFDARHALIATLLSADVQRTGVQRFRQALASVRGGVVPSVEINGNVCSVMIGQERVLILDALAVDGIGNACAVRVDVFDRILDAWETALQEARGI